MGRSVNYLNNAEVVIYFSFDNDGDESDYPADLAWDDLIDNLVFSIQKRLPSYEVCKNEWDNNETRIILQNRLCNIGISEYCGLVSLSVAPRNSDNLDSFDTFRDNFAVRHAKQIKHTLEGIVDLHTASRLNRVGTFSNGTGAFESANNKEAIYDNANRIL